MSQESIKKPLSKLVEFCNKNELEYIVTGTVALSMLGVPSNFTPNDIDIKIFKPDEKQEAKLKELQFLSGLENCNYENSKCYSFLIDGVKINAIIENDKCFKDCISTEVIPVLIDTVDNSYIVPVQKVFFALRAKMKLNRPKDKAYMLSLISNCASL